MTIWVSFDSETWAAYIHHVAFDRSCSDNIWKRGASLCSAGRSPFHSDTIPSTSRKTLHRSRGRDMALGASMHQCPGPLNYLPGIGELQDVWCRWACRCFALASSKAYLRRIDRMRSGALCRGILERKTKAAVVVRHVQGCLRTACAWASESTRLTLRAVHTRTYRLRHC